MAERTFAFDDLAALLERFPVERAGTKLHVEVTESQLQLLLSRMTALTTALRDAESNEPTRLASRILLNDLALVAGQFRGRANELRGSLAGALARLRETLAQAEAPLAD